MWMNMTLKILGHDYEVAVDSTLASTRGLAGLCDLRTSAITIDGEQSAGRREETLMHEVFEALDYHLELGLKHRQITALSEGLYAVLKTNDIVETLEFITKEEA